MGGRRLAAVAAHKRRQDGGVVHAPVEPPQKRPHALRGGAGRVVAAAAAAVPVSAPSPQMKRLHLHLLPSSPVMPVVSVGVLGGRHAQGVLPAVAEATVLVLVVLQEVVDGPQPQGVSRARAPAAPAGAAAVTAPAAAVRIDLFTPLTVDEREREGRTKYYN